MRVGWPEGWKATAVGCSTSNGNFAEEMANYLNSVLIYAYVVDWEKSMRKVVGAHTHTDRPTLALRHCLATRE